MEGYKYFRWQMLKKYLKKFVYWDYEGISDASFCAIKVSFVITS